MSHVHAAIGSHHLEYGFPSTHSTNSVSIALYILSYVHELYAAEAVSARAFTAWCGFLTLYAFSIVYGRIYTAMHSFTDCAAGVFLGTAIWAVYWISRDLLKTWVLAGGWEGKSDLLPV
jgi:dihydrosphingosine 1-phosphate phosphatase